MVEPSLIMERSLVRVDPPQLFLDNQKHLYVVSGMVIVSSKTPTFNFIVSVCILYAFTMAGSTAVTPIRTSTIRYNRDCMPHRSLLKKTPMGLQEIKQKLPDLSFGKISAKQNVDLRHQAGWCSDSHATSHRSIGSALTDSIPDKYEIPDEVIPLSRELLPEPFLQRLPWRYELANPMVIVHLISNTLGRLTFFNDMVPRAKSTVTRFHSNRAPQVSACEYLRRLTCRLCLSSPILVMMVVYIRQLCTTHTMFDVSSLTAHRLLLSCALVASKSLSDFAWSNQLFASAGGVSAAEMAILELELLKYLEWDVAPRQEQLSACYIDLILDSNGYLAKA
ncbi:cyclin-domain-containing protein [Aspergillus bertholletiae]|uniref:Cyclin-domain-containing protein n=1 Tax=Aspergillus bertholletiae TaxID=1226010 RepID=A0A5N7BJ41_9EURO|nr:cyclin-domain-containing protein [Aspergillus bertholletiae]